MTEHWEHIIVTAIVCSMVFGAIATIALCVNADTLVRAWQRWHRGSECELCEGTGRFGKTGCSQCQGKGV